MARQIGTGPCFRYACQTLFWFRSLPTGVESSELAAILQTAFHVGTSLFDYHLIGELIENIYAKLFIALHFEPSKY
jgi:hypothetical protein